MTDREIMLKAAGEFDTWIAAGSSDGTHWQQVQAKLAAWQGRNFGAQPIERMVLGAAEEVGELAHATLKGLQGIRVGTDPDAVREKAGDSIADAAIYLMQAATALRLDFESLVMNTASKVMSRDWVAAPADGGSDG